MAYIFYETGCKPQFPATGSPLDANQGALSTTTWPTRIKDPVKRCPGRTEIPSKIWMEMTVSRLLTKLCDMLAPNSASDI